MFERRLKGQQPCRIIPTSEQERLNYLAIMKQKERPGPMYSLERRNEILKNRTDLNVRVPQSNGNMQFQYNKTREILDSRSDIGRPIQKDIGFSGHGDLPMMAQMQGNISYEKGFRPNFIRNFGSIMEEILPAPEVMAGHTFITNLTNTSSSFNNIPEYNYKAMFLEKRRQDKIGQKEKTVKPLDIPNIMRVQPTEKISILNRIVQTGFNEKEGKNKEMFTNNGIFMKPCPQDVQIPNFDQRFEDHFHNVYHKELKSGNMVQIPLSYMKYEPNIYNTGGRLNSGMPERAKSYNAHTPFIPMGKKKEETFSVYDGVYNYENMGNIQHKTNEVLNEIKTAPKYLNNEINRFSGKSSITGNDNTLFKMRQEAIRRGRYCNI